MRYLALIASALWLVARALTHHARAAARRRGHRVRRYAARPLPPRPSVATGPIPLILPSHTTGVAAPPLPPQHRRVAAPAPAPVDVLSPDRGRIDRSRLGVAVLVDISQPQPQQRQAVAA